MSGDKVFAIRYRDAIIDVTPDYLPGDPPPPDGFYNAWHAWAEAQHEAGLTQKRCSRCSRWSFPSELSGKYDIDSFTTESGDEHRERSPICKRCDREPEAPAPEPPDLPDAKDPTEEFEPPPVKAKVVHAVGKVRNDGAVSALCFAKIRPINLRRATWCLDPKYVTCPKCLAMASSEASL